MRTWRGEVSHLDGINILKRRVSKTKVRKKENKQPEAHVTTKVDVERQSHILGSNPKDVDVTERRLVVKGCQ